MVDVLRKIGEDGGRRCGGRSQFRHYEAPPIGAVTTKTSFCCLCLSTIATMFLISVVFFPNGFVNLTRSMFRAAVHAKVNRLCVCVLDVYLRKYCIL